MQKIFYCMIFVTFQSCNDQQGGKKKPLRPQAKIEFLGEYEIAVPGSLIGLFSFQNTAEYSYSLRSIIRDDDGSIYCHHPSFLYMEDDKWEAIDITYAGIVDLTNIAPKEKFIFKVPLNGLERKHQKENYILIVDEIKSVPFEVHWERRGLGEGAESKYKGTDP